MAWSAQRRATLGNALVTGATVLVVLACIGIAAHRPAILSNQADAVELQFNHASSLQTMRLYVDHVREAQEELWIEHTPASWAEYSQARRWFTSHVAWIGRWNPGYKAQATVFYNRYVNDTLSAFNGDGDVTPAMLTSDYATLESYVYEQARQSYHHAFKAQIIYDSFRARNDEERFLFLLFVGIATMILLGLSQFYRVRLQHLSEERIALLSHAALNDALTGLRNLRAFEEDLPKGAAVAQRFNHPVSLMLIDVDRFKEANDHAGHAAGDELLKRIASLLHTLREADGAYRLGGDEFAVILPGTAGVGAEVLARRLVSEPVGQGKAVVTLSAGVAQLRPGEALSDWRERADIALYEAKRRGGRTAVLFEHIEAQARFVGANAVSRVRELLAHEGVQTAFQPIMNREATEIIAFEALARPLREYHFAGPTEAFDAAARIGRIMDLDLLCIRSALGAVRDYGIEAPIFLNVTPATLEHPLFAAATIGAILGEYGMEPSRVVIEITERTIGDMSAVVRSAEALRHLGIRIALDDAGAGSSGMTLLSSLTFDFVKLDRTLLLEGHNPKNRGILAGILAISDAMGALIIAEGIESPELLEFARNLHRIVSAHSIGVRALQGYLLGRPRFLTSTPMAAEEWLTA